MFPAIMMKIVMMMMKTQQFFFLTLISLLHFSQAYNILCPPSSCGAIRHIKHPFRLKGDPWYCGYPELELVCENNVTSIYLNSYRYYVKAIIYSSRSTIRLVDASLNNQDNCSFPTSSAYHYNFTFDLHSHYRHLTDTNPSYPVHLMSCPYPLHNSSLFTDVTTHCASNSSMYAYIKVGSMRASEVPPADIYKYVALAIGLALGLFYATKLVMFPMGLSFFIIKFLRRHLSVYEEIEGFLQSNNELTAIRYSYSDIKKMTKARGTIGYVAPELINRGIGTISYKADVYSFGMMLMDIVGLKRDLVGNNDSSSKYFPYWIYDHINQGKDYTEIGCVDENGGAREVCRKMTIVALWCIQMNPGDRPSMNEVLKMLEGDVERMRIPEYPSQSTQIVANLDQTGTTCSSDYVSFPHHDDSFPSVEITVQE
ncbi:hypothetical protein SASPL_149336 [Salvia splendens]|uniref:Protein kinase domain-containing protein n=1 Tax=Salvia splendens TaxID=180675 RepID=A0A8X8WBI8_SALSN|nr:hypothetical protein SASPL_149336 [Salvia splendens]